MRAKSAALPCPWTVYVTLLSGQAEEFARGVGDYREEEEEAEGDNGELALRSDLCNRRRKGLAEIEGHAEVDGGGVDGVGAVVYHEHVV